MTAADAVQPDQDAAAQQNLEDYAAGSETAEQEETADADAAVTDEEQTLDNESAPAGKNLKGAAAGSSEETGTLIKARDLDEYIDLTVPDLDDTSLDVSKNSGKISGGEEDLTFREAFGKPFKSVKGSSREICDAIDDTEGYQVTGESKKQIHVLSDYAMKRVIVEKELKRCFGAETAVVYDGKTLLTYDSEEATKEGYEKLTKKYGDRRVRLDSVITLGDTVEMGTAEEATAQTAAKDPCGWGTKCMYLDYQKSKYAEGENTVTVAVLDTGINENHEVFSDTVISEDSRNFVNAGKPSEAYADDNGHGTMVSGIIAESAGTSVELLVLKVMKNNSKGEAVASLDSAMAAMEYAAEHNVDIINMSFGGYYNPSKDAEKKSMETLESVLADVASQGILICAASGNTSSNMVKNSGELFYPAQSPSTVAVGAIRRNTERASFSNYGSKLDFVAPGAELTLPDYKNNKGYLSDRQGTSFSTPYICACAAFLFLADEDNTSDTVYRQMVQIADDLGDSGRDIYYGYGMPNFSNDGSLVPVEIEDIDKLKVTVSTKKFGYDGKEKHPTVTVEYEGRNLTSYELTYPDNSPEIGTHKVKMTLVGSYAEPISVTKTFQVVPKKVSFSEGSWVSSVGNGRVKIKWNKSQGSYQLKVANNQSFKKSKTYSTANTSRSIAVKSGKTYYVKVRAIKKVSGKKYYSEWSDTKVFRTYTRF